MTRTIFLPVFISIVALSSFALGWFASGHKDQLSSNAEEVLVSRFVSILDMKMYRSEPYSSYWLSVVLLEATEEENALDQIRSVLISDLNERKESIISYCKARAFEGARDQCLETIEKAENLIRIYSS